MLRLNIKFQEKKSNVDKKVVFQEKSLLNFEKKVENTHTRVIHFISLDSQIASAVA